MLNLSKLSKLCLRLNSYLVFLSSSISFSLYRSPTEAGPGLLRWWDQKQGGGGIVFVSKLTRKGPFADETFRPGEPRPRACIDRRCGSRLSCCCCQIGRCVAKAIVAAGGETLDEMRARWALMWVRAVALRSGIMAHMIKSPKPGTYGSLGTSFPYLTTAPLPWRMDPSL